LQQQETEQRNTHTRRHTFLLNKIDQKTEQNKRKNKKRQQNRNYENNDDDDVHVEKAIEKYLK